jgi:uncharacterized protein (DUF2252 family)
MSYGAQQKTEKGNQYRHVKSGGKIQKKFQHRRQRQKMKDLNYIPQYNRYEAGWGD